MADHQHGVRTEHGEVVGHRLGVRGADTDVDDRDAVLTGSAVVPGRHLHVGVPRALCIGKAGAELFDVHGVVREEDVSLKGLGRCAAIVRKSFHRQRYALGCEHE